MKKFLLIIIIIGTIIFSACGDKKENESIQPVSQNGDISESFEAGPDESYEALPPDFPSGDSLQLVHTVEFNNKRIPMTVFYSREAGSEYYITDMLVFEYDGRKHAISLDDVREKFPFEDPNDYGLIEVSTDYNFDNYMDIAVLSSRGVRHSWYDIFIYNPQTKSYYHHKELSKENDVWTDADTQTVKVHTISGHAGLIYTSRVYKWVNGQLTLFENVNQDYDDGTELYTCITLTLQNNGTWSEKGETFKAEDFY